MTCSFNNSVVGAHTIEVVKSLHNHKNLIYLIGVKAHLPFQILYTIMFSIYFYVIPDSTLIVIEHISFGIEGKYDLHKLSIFFS